MYQAYPYEWRIQKVLYIARFQMYIHVHHLMPLWPIKHNKKQTATSDLVSRTCACTLAMYTIHVIETFYSDMQNAY